MATDYDGTLSEMEQSREQSRPNPALERILREITGKAKLAIVTSKSFDFVSTRIPYANSWGCVSGLDLRFDDGGEFAVSCSIDMEEELSRARKLVGDVVHYEEKRGPGSLLGFAIDWRGRRKPWNLDRLVAAMEGDGVYVLKDKSHPFIDFFCSKPDKGAALSRIKKEFGVAKGTMVLGDSRADNDAFREGDVTVAVEHGQELDGLDCEFIVNREDLSRFLAALYKEEMAFRPDLPGLSRKGGG